MLKASVLALVGALFLFSPQFIIERITGTTPAATGGQGNVFTMDFTAADCPTWTCTAASSCTNNPPCVNGTYAGKQQGVSFCALNIYLPSGNPGGNFSQIVDAADHPAGAGHKAWRVYYGDGTNVLSGAPRIANISGYTDLYILFYYRYKSGFEYSSLSYHKFLYYSGIGGSPLYDLFRGNWRWISQQGGLNNHDAANGTGFDATMGGTVGDGQWHWIETRLQNSTQIGHVTTWTDQGGVNTPIIDTNVDWGADGFVGNSLLDAFIVIHNSASPVNGPHYVDIGWIAAGTSRIGPIN